MALAGTAGLADILGWDVRNAGELDWGLMKGALPIRYSEFDYREFDNIDCDRNMHGWGPLHTKLA